jgi:hypothetical protein
MLNIWAAQKRIKDRELRLAREEEVQRYKNKVQSKSNSSLTCKQEKIQILKRTTTPEYLPLFKK